MNSQSLSFTDKQVALLLNALQLVIVASGMHPEVKDYDGCAAHLNLALEALTSFDPNEYAKLYTMLVKATENFDMGTAEMYRVHLERQKREAPLTDEMRARFRSN